MNIFKRKKFLLQPPRKRKLRPESPDLELVHFFFHHSYSREINKGLRILSAEHFIFQLWNSALSQQLENTGMNVILTGTRQHNLKTDLKTRIPGQRAVQCSSKRLSLGVKKYDSGKGYTRAGSSGV